MRGHRRALFPSDSGNIVQNHTCHYNVTRPLWSDLEATKALKLGLEHPYGHLHFGSCPAMRYIVIAVGKAQGNRSADGAGRGKLCLPEGSHHTLL